MWEKEVQPTLSASALQPSGVSYLSHRLSSSRAIRATGGIFCNRSGLARCPCNTVELTGMSLFQAILDSVENPNHAGTQQDLHGLVNLAQYLPGGGNAQAIQPILSVLGSHVQTALSQQQQNQGSAAAQQTVSDLSHPGVGVQDLENLFGQSGFNSLIGELSRRTGLNSQLIMTFLPMAIPVVMKLLAAGTHQTDAQAPNPVLNGFIGSNQNGGALLTEAFQLASQFLARKPA